MVISNLKEQDIINTLSIFIDTLVQFILLVNLVPKQSHSWPFFPINIKTVINKLKKIYINKSIVILHIEIFSERNIVSGTKTSINISKNEQNLISFKFTL